MILEIVSAGQRLTSLPLREGEPLVLGRHPDCDRVLPDPHVSRRQVEFELRAGDRVFVRNLGTKNPVLFRDSPLDEGEIGEGDRVSFGETTVVVRRPIDGEGEGTPSVRLLADGATPLEHTDRLVVDPQAATQWLSAEPDPADTQHRNKLQALYRFAEAAGHLDDRDALLDLALQLLFEAVPAERGFVGLGEPPAGERAEGDSFGFDVTRVRNESEESGRSIDMSQTILDEIQLERRAFLVRDVRDDFGDGAGPSVARLGIRSFLCAPLLIGDEFHGVVYLDQTGRATRAFLPGDLEFAQGIARLLAMALDDFSLRESLRSENLQLRQILERRSRIVADSEAMSDVLDRVARVAERDSTVLVLGETGTGKELIARTIHDRSERRNGPFIAFNCALSSPALIESELFGHAKGAFTDATRDHRGKFVLASGGTLFLDEIGDMPLDTQVKLLRVLQERQVWPVGSEAPVAVDIRLVAATHRDLEQLKSESSFREDLYYRVAVLTIELPRLADRGDDVLLIARSLLPDGMSFDPAAERALLGYRWPGNVRELQNAVEQASFNARSKKIKLGDLPASIAKEGRRDRVEVPLTTLSEVEARTIRRTLRALGGNKKRTAETLGISRETLYQKLKLYQIGS